MNGWYDSKDGLPDEKEYPILTYFTTDSHPGNIKRYEKNNVIKWEDGDGNPPWYHFYWRPAVIKSPDELFRTGTFEVDNDEEWPAVEAEREEIAALVKDLEVGMTDQEGRTKHYRAIYALKERLRAYL